MKATMKRLRISSEISTRDWLHRNKDIPESRILINAVRENLISYNEIGQLFEEAFGIEDDEKDFISIDETSLRDFLRYRLCLPDDFYISYSANLKK